MGPAAVGISLRRRTSRAVYAAVEQGPRARPERGERFPSTRGPAGFPGHLRTATVSQASSRPKSWAPEHLQIPVLCPVGAADSPPDPPPVLLPDECGPHVPPSPRSGLQDGQDRAQQPGGNGGRSTSRSTANKALMSHDFCAIPRGHTTFRSRERFSILILSMHTLLQNNVKV